MTNNRTVPAVTAAEVAAAVGTGLVALPSEQWAVAGLGGLSLFAFNRIRRTASFRRWTVQRIYRLPESAPGWVVGVLERLPQPHLVPAGLLPDGQSQAAQVAQKPRQTLNARPVAQPRAGLLLAALGDRVSLLTEEEEKRPAKKQPDDAIVLGPEPEPEPEPEQTTEIQFDVLSLLDSLELLLAEEAVLVLGPKGSGKTTLGMALFNAAVAKGRKVAVIDPHGTKNPWPKDGSVPIYGIGMAYDEADAAIERLFQEMRERYSRVGGDDEHVYCFIDEVPSLREECENWSRFISKLLREARKVNIHLVVLSQSYLVGDLGLNSNTRTNLSVVALGNARSRYVMREMTQLDREEKEALVRQVRDNPRAAVLDLGGTPSVLDLTGATKVTTLVKPKPWHLLPPGRGVSKAAQASRTAQTQQVVARAADQALPLVVTRPSSDDEFLAAMLEKYGEKAGEKAGVVSSVSPGNLSGTSIGTREVPSGGGTQVPRGSDAGSARFQGTPASAKMILDGATAEERRNLGTCRKLLTTMGRQEAIMTAFRLTSKGRAYSRAVELLNALQCLEAAGLVK